MNKRIKNYLNTAKSVAIKNRWEMLLLISYMTAGIFTCLAEPDKVSKRVFVTVLGFLFVENIQKSYYKWKSEIDR